MNNEFVMMDIITSAIAFGGLASLVLAYLNYIPKWFDTFAFFWVFFAFGWYCSITPDMPTSYRVCTSLSFGIGVLVVLAVKVWFLKRKLARNQAQSPETQTPP